MRHSFLRRVLRPAALVLALVGLLGPTATAQTVAHSGRTCGTENPSTHEILQTVVAAEQWMAANASQVAAHRASGTVVTIPVAYHIISSGPSTGQGNVPDQWVTDQMDVLNAAFAPMGFQFALAFQQRVQNAGWTTMAMDSPAEVAMKQTLHLNPARFLNIYAVPDLGDLLGWATFPTSGSETDFMQGVVLLTGSMPGGNAAPYNLGDTGTHEVGHFVGLFHTFQGGCAAPGDGVADTPAVASSNFGCPTGRDSCPSDGLGPDQVENFMDYTDDACMDRFTQGQADRSLALMSQFRPTIMTQSGAVLSASTLSYGPVSVGQPVSRSLYVVNLTAEPLDISSVTSTNAAYTVDVTSGSVPAGGSLAITVTFDPSGAGDATGTLSVVTTSTDVGTLSVALSGTGVLSPVVSIPAPAIAARAAVGAQTTASLGINNTGGGVLFYTFGGFGRAPGPGVAADATAVQVPAVGKDDVDLRQGARSLDGGGPDAFGYSWADSNEPGGPAYSWVDIASTGTAVTLADDGTVTVPLPFAFPFYGADQNSVRIVSNGFLAFGGTSTAFTNAAIPTASAPNSVIAVYWDDLDPSSGGSIRYQDMGDGRFVVSWIGVPHYAQSGAQGTFTFQAILSQDGSIVTQYQTIAPVGADVNSATIGIENADGTDGLQVTFNAPYVENNLAIRFSTGVQWIASVSPATGIVAPNGSTSVTVGLTADGLEEGVYQDLLVMTTNDPQRTSVPFHVVFAVGDALPPPALTAPFIGERGVNPTTPFAWLPVTDATSYDLEVAIDQGFSSVVYQGTPTGTSADASLSAMTDYFWRMRTQTATATSDWTLPLPFRTGVMVAADDDPARAAGFALGTFYPNPTRGLVTVPFALDEPQAAVSVRVLDVTGRLVATLVDGALGAGAHQVQWQSADQPAGIYLVQLRANGQVETGRVVVLR